MMVSALRGLGDSHGAVLAPHRGPGPGPDRGLWAPGLGWGSRGLRTGICSQAWGPGPVPSRPPKPFPALSRSRSPLPAPFPGPVSRPVPGSRKRARPAGSDALRARPGHGGGGARDEAVQWRRRRRAGRGARPLPALRGVDPDPRPDVSEAPGAHRGQAARRGPGPGRDPLPPPAASRALSRRPLAPPGPPSPLPGAPRLCRDLLPPSPRCLSRVLPSPVPSPPLPFPRGPSRAGARSRGLGEAVPAGPVPAGAERCGRTWEAFLGAEVWPPGCETSPRPGGSLAAPLFVSRDWICLPRLASQVWAGSGENLGVLLCSWERGKLWRWGLSAHSEACFSTFPFPSGSHQVMFAELQVR